MSGPVIDLDGRSVELTSLDRVLWPNAGFTKGDLVDYYVRVADLLLPHVRGRGLTLARYPEGVHASGFAQTECRGRPDWMATQEVRLASGEMRRHCVVEDAAGLAWIANQNAIELHPFLALAESPDRPEELVVDLDPPPGDGPAPPLRDLALRAREELERRGLEPWVKTSGAGGLHVLAPLGRDATFAAAKELARTVAARLAAADPDRVSDSASPARRGRRAFVDWTRTSERATLAAAYSLRAMRRPSVSMPLAWEELESTPPDELWFGPEDVAGARG